MERYQRYQKHMEKLKKSTRTERVGRRLVSTLLTLTTVHRLVPLKMRSAESIRLPNRGRSYPEHPSNYRMTRAMAAVEEYLIRRGDGLVILFTPPFDKGRPGSRLYQRATFQACAKTADSIRTRQFGRLIAYAMLGDGERAGELFSLLNPINHSSYSSWPAQVQSRTLRCSRRCLCRAATHGRGGWTWYTGSAGWMYRAGLESILGFKLSGDRLKMVSVCSALVARV